MERNYICGRNENKHLKIGHGVCGVKITNEFSQDDQDRIIKIWNLAGMVMNNCLAETGRKCLVNCPVKNFKNKLRPSVS
jgi:hypothetical protein